MMGIKEIRNFTMIFTYSAFCKMPIPATTEAEAATPAGEVTRATGDTGAATAETRPPGEAPGMALPSIRN